MLVHVPYKLKYVRCRYEQFRTLVCECLATCLCVKSKVCHKKNLAAADDIGLQEEKAAESSPLLDNANNRLKGSPTASASAAETEAAAAAAAGQLQLVSGTERLLVNIRDLLQTSVSAIARQRHDQDENQRMMNDWMVAAAVIDRISFILITCLFTTGTVALIVLCSVPHD